MKKIVIAFGLISGVVITALMWLMLALVSAGVASHSVVFGYAIMVIALSLVFFGVKSYRDNNGGKITFFKGLQVGILISLIAALCYGISWEAYYRTDGGDFIEQYSVQYVEEMRSNGASDAEIAETQKQMAEFAEQYKNFFVRFGMTLMEILPVGVIVTLISAGLLRRKELLPAQ
ncbi:MAG: DUF4199 domain-containing protein [Pyrinomonadaceae bacterium]